MAKKYALHPGHIFSKSDHERHYIGASQLARLYELLPHEYIIWDDTFDGRYREDYIHLYPSYEGNYGRPNA